MVTTSLAAAANRARLTVRAAKQLLPQTGRLADRVPASTAIHGSDSADGVKITDEANWLDIDLEEQRALDEKLSAFLDVDDDVEHKERQWLLPNP